MSSSYEKRRDLIAQCQRVARFLMSSGGGEIRARDLVDHLGLSYRIARNIMRRFAAVDLVDEDITEGQGGVGGQIYTWRVPDASLLEPIVTSEELAARVLWPAVEDDEYDDASPGEAPLEAVQPPEEPAADPFAVIVQAFQSCTEELKTLRGAVSELAGVVAAQGAQRDSLVLDELVRITEVIKRLEDRPAAVAPNSLDKETFDDKEMVDRLIREFQEDRVVLGKVLAAMQFGAHEDVSFIRRELVALRADVHKRNEAAMKEHADIQKDRKNFKDRFTLPLSRYLETGNKQASFLVRSMDTLFQAISKVSKGDAFAYRRPVAEMTEEMDKPAAKMVLRTAPVADPAKSVLRHQGLH